MNYGNDDSYVFFKKAGDQAGVFKANRFMGIRPQSTTTTKLFFMALTHDNNAVDTILLTHGANKFVEVAKTICSALSHAGANRDSMTTIIDVVGADYFDAGQNTPLATTQLITDIGITYDA
tara:strand:+ start:1054 stop:1416 length:363 start_codon:yes stop_codon:yes gene_type:complete